MHAVFLKYSKIAYIMYENWYSMQISSFILGTNLKSILIFRKHAELLAVNAHVYETIIS